MSSVRGSGGAWPGGKRREGGKKIEKKGKGGENAALRLVTERV